MPDLIFTQAALHDLGRLRAFLQTRSPEAAQRARAAILEAMVKMAQAPMAYKPVPGVPHLRDLVIPFGAAGYVARYRYEQGSPVVVLRIKHQREAGFEEGA